MNPILRVFVDELRRDPELRQELAGLLRDEPEPNGAASPYLTPEEAAEFLRCSRQRIYDLHSSRRLSRLKEGGRTLVLRAELEQLVTEEQRRRRAA